MSLLDRVAGRFFLLLIGTFVMVRSSVAQEAGAALPGTKPLVTTGDVASDLVAGVDQFLLEQIDQSVAKRAGYWKRDLSSPAAYSASVDPNRKRLAHILGVRDQRVSPVQIRRLRDHQFALVPTDARVHPAFRVDVVSWPAFGDVTGEGLELTPISRRIADVIVIPDADQAPEQLAGLVVGLSDESQVARRLAESGFRVFVPALLDRTVTAEWPCTAHQPRVCIPLCL